MVEVLKRGLKALLTIVMTLSLSLLALFSRVILWCGKDNIYPGPLLSRAFLVLDLKFSTTSLVETRVMYAKQHYRLAC